MKKKVVIGVIVIVLAVLAYLYFMGYFSFTGEAIKQVGLGHPSYCRAGFSGHPCAPGEGDCDRGTECASGFCEMQWGTDLCGDCPVGTVWDGTGCQ